MVAVIVEREIKIENLWYRVLLLVSGETVGGDCVVVTSLEDQLSNDRRIGMGRLAKTIKIWKNLQITEKHIIPFSNGI